MSSLPFWVRLHVICAMEQEEGVQYRATGVCCRNVRLWKCEMQLVSRL